MLPEVVQGHISGLTKEVARLLDQTPISYRNVKPSSFPETKGIYVTTLLEGEVLRAGKTGGGNATLRQRLYSNHPMGNQAGNLRTQLVDSGQCADMEEARIGLKRIVQFDFWKSVMIQPEQISNTSRSEEHTSE